MAEPWYLLGLCRTKRASLAKQAQQIRQDCAKNHNKKNIVECPECYQNLISAIRDRYLRSQDTEWFTGRRAFLKDIDAMFNDAKDYKIHPSKVEARIQDEKKKWMRENMKAFVNGIDDPLIKDALQDRLNDKDIPLEDLAADIELSIGGDDSTTQEQLHAIIDQLAAVKTPEERLAAYKEAFFLEHKDQPLPEHRKKYVDMLTAGKTMDQVIEQITPDQKAVDSAKAQKNELQDQLRVLERARTTHGVKMAKKAAAKQEREDRAKNREKDREKDRERERELGRRVPPVPPELYNQPPCHSCGNEVNLQQGLRCCMVCQLLAGWDVQKSTVYCSDKCFHHTRSGQKAHAQGHTCAAGADCMSLQDEDVDMDRQRSLVFCKECVDALKLPTVYCSLKCYEGHFQKHREMVHLPGRAKTSTERDDAGELVYEDDARTRYHAKDLRGGVRALYESVNGWENRFHVEMGTV